MRILRCGLVSLAACDPVHGAWVGTCEYKAGGEDHEEELELDLDGADSAGMGAGTGKATERRDTRRGDVLFEVLPPDFALDVYLPEGDLILLRGTVNENWRASGTCGSPKVEEFQLEALVDCVLDVDPFCDTNKKWKPDGFELAPVERRDLDGTFSLHRD